MSQENVAIVRQAFASINQGQDIEGVLELAADDFEMDWSNSIGPANGVYRGREQVRTFSSSFLEAFEEVQWEPREIIDVDESRLIVINHVRMRGRGSGIVVEATGAQLWTFADGKAQSVKLYQSKAEALAAVGQSE